MSKNVFKDLGFGDVDAEIMQFKALLLIKIQEAVKEQQISRRELEKIWDVPQPRVSEIMTGKIDNVSIERLMYYLSQLGTRVVPSFKELRA